MKVCILASGSRGNAKALLEAGDCMLEFFQSGQGYRIAAEVRALAEAYPAPGITDRLSVDA